MFGRNAAGGVVSIITREPSATPSVDATIGYGNFQTLTACAYVTGGIAENVAADLATQYADQHDGFGTNLFNGRDVNRGHEFSVRSKIVWNIGPNTSIRLAADYATSDNDYGIARQILRGTVSTLGQVGPANFFDANSNLQPASRLRTGGGSIKIDQALSFAQLTSITAFSSARSVSISIRTRVRSRWSMPPSSIANVSSPRNSSFHRCPKVGSSGSSAAST